MTDAGLVVLRGGGDLATGVAWRLWRSGIPLVVCELAEPLTIRRTVALSSAVIDGVAIVESMTGRSTDVAGVPGVLAAREVPVLVSPSLPPLPAAVVVDARMAKRNLGTTIDDAPLVVGLGPGFTAGVDCHAVIETNRGHRLGRVLWSGSAEADTGVPGVVGGRTADRVVRAPCDGAVAWRRRIGDRVEAGEPIGRVGERELRAPFTGAIRGLIRPGMRVPAGLKIADLDPRADVDCYQISDKALAIGGGVLEAVLGDRAGRRG